jgi:polyferredoxin
MNISRHKPMKIVTFLLILALLFVAWGFYLGRLMFGGGAISIILMACFIFYFAGGFCPKT